MKIWKKKNSTVNQHVTQLSTKLKPLIASGTSTIYNKINPPKRGVTTGQALAGLVIAIGTATLSYWLIKRYLAHNVSPIGNVWKSKIISFLANRTPQIRLSNSTIRKSFLTSVDLYYPPLPKSNNHSHPESCTARNASTLQVVQIARELGLQPYFVQMSNSDVKSDYAGCRTYHWSKDVAVPPSGFNPKRNDAVVMIDVDMYIDMPRTLATYPRVYLISTFQPTKVADHGSNYDFTFNGDNEVLYQVSGGAKYQHQVWNYATDDLIVTTPGDLFGFGLWWKTVIYSIERRQYDDHHQIILLSPLKIIHSPVFSLTSWLKGNLLRRLNVAVHKDDITFLRMDIVTKTGRKRSTGIAMTYQSATIKVEDDDTIASQSRLNSTKISAHQIASLLQNNDSGVCSILAEYHQRKINYSPDNVTPMDKSINRYQFDPKNYDPDAKPLMVPFMGSMISEPYVPDSCKNNEQRAVDGRVNEIKNDKIELTPEMMRYETEFAEQLFKTPYTLHPVSQDVVYEKQNRPAQRSILNNAVCSTDLVDPDMPVKSFMKAESYDGVKDPRIISTIPGITKLSYSQFTYAFAEHMRQQPWYAFGKTPLTIANRVAEIAKGANLIHNTDFSRFDGRVSNILRSLERICVLRGFDKHYHPELAELLLSQYGQRAVTKFGIFYSTDFTRASGSPETADYNSLDNAFVAFVAFRRTKINGVFLTPEQAYARLGIYGGDDGVTSDVDADIYMRSASDVGQLLEVETIPRDAIGVSFLSRFYSPYVWSGDNNSCCDLPRQLQKLHITVALPPGVTALEKLGEKLSGYSLMDRNTPILGTLIQTYELMHPELFHSGIKDASSKAKVANFYSMYELNDQYPNSNDGHWMEIYMNIWLPLFDHDLLHSFVQAVIARRTSILNVPKCMPTTSIHFGKMPVMVNGQPKTPCNYGILCRDPNCPYEHQCVYCKTCTNQNCNLFHNDPDIQTPSSNQPYVNNTNLTFNVVGKKTQSNELCKYDDQHCKLHKTNSCGKKHRKHKHKTDEKLTTTNSEISATAKSSKNEEKSS